MNPIGFFIVGIPSIIVFIPLSRYLWPAGINTLSDILGAVLLYALIWGSILITVTLTFRSKAGR